ncbi:EboA domain-containing protein [Streptomyces pratensis]|uniref:EboA domain-containing protein n=1 Tax=Streptomyces pratensis TaxID=1169025 RepID=UPI00301A52BE
MLKSREELDAALGEAARAWLDEALAEAAHEALGAGAAPADATRAEALRAEAARTGTAPSEATRPEAVRRAAGARTAPGSGRPEGASDAAHAASAPGARPAPDTVPDGRSAGPPDPHTSTPPPWELRYAAAGRHCGREHADSVRSLLLVEARASLSCVTRLYAHGTAAERRAVLLTLHRLDLGGSALPLVEDALRTNDPRLVAAAVGPYAAVRLDPHAWRHAVLKCLFTEVPVEAVARLADRARGDGELARMLSDFAAERTAAGRAVPEDLRTVLALTVPADGQTHQARPATAAPLAPTEES